MKLSQLTRSNRLREEEFGREVYWGDPARDAVLCPRCVHRRLPGRRSSKSMQSALESTLMVA